MKELVKKNLIGEFFILVLIVTLLMVVGANTKQNPAQIKLENSVIKISATSNDPHNYAKPEDGFQNTTQIANRQQSRNFKSYVNPIRSRSIGQLLKVHMISLPSCQILEQQRSIPVFLRRLLI